MRASIRRALHFAAADLLYSTGALTFWRFFRQTVLGRRETCVLGLHRVLTNREQARTNSLEGMVLTETTFAKLLEYLQRQFEMISLEEFLAGEERTRRTSSKPRCLLTFDDGWGDTYSTAYQWLRRFRMPAVVFLATGAMETKGGFWIEQVNGAFKVPAMRSQMESILNEVMTQKGSPRSAEDAIEWLKRMPTKQRDDILRRMLSVGVNGTASAQADDIDFMMSWAQAIEMGRDGIGMGAHTVSHPLLTHEGEATVERELRCSKAALEAKLGGRVRAFAYPNGDWNERVRQETEQAGYECAFTTRPGWYRSGQNRYTIPRILLHEGNVTGRDGQFSPAMFHLTLAGRA